MRIEHFAAGAGKGLRDLDNSRNSNSDLVCIQQSVLRTSLNAFFAVNSDSIGGVWRIFFNFDDGDQVFRFWPCAMMPQTARSWRVQLLSNSQLKGLIHHGNRWCRPDKIGFKALPMPTTTPATYEKFCNSVETPTNEIYVSPAEWTECFFSDDWHHVYLSSLVKPRSVGTAIARRPVQSVIFSWFFA